ncbi:MAG: glycosyltransferase family 2 protein [Balneolales bacterium]|nr:glycosyltransferase family 2 protein [Balneolales bacterium]
MLSTERPTVTVMIPTFNEERHIEGVIRSFQQSTYDNISEILIGDGRSTDRTREIVSELADKDDRIKLIDNPDKIQSASLNQMITLAQGEVLVRADAHCEYDTNYVSACVKAMRDSGAVCVGGAQRFVASNAVQAGISLAVRTPVGSGNARYRDNQYDGPAETVFLGCFLKSIFAKTGLFRTDMLVNEDAELNIRILKHFPNGIHISSDIKVWYYPRSSYKALWIQYFRYGTGRVKTRSLHHGEGGLRAAIPFCTLTALVLITISELLLSGSITYSVALLLAMFLFITLVSARVSVQTRKTFGSEIWRGDVGARPSFLSRWMHTLATSITFNLAHALGFAWQLFFKPPFSG